MPSGRTNAGHVYMEGHKIINVGKPTDDNDAATHGYVNARFWCIFSQALEMIQQNSNMSVMRSGDSVMKGSLDMGRTRGYKCWWAYYCSRRRY